MSSLSEEEVEDWKNGLTDEKTGKLLSCKARNEYLSTIKKLFTFCRLNTIEKLENLLKEILLKNSILFQMWKRYSMFSGRRSMRISRCIRVIQVSY